MNLLYNTAIALYSMGAKVASLRNPKIRRMLQGHKDTFRHRAITDGSLHGCVWFHAASLGEFEQGRPLIERLRAAHPDVPVLLTFFSPSGYEVRKDYPLADAVAYLPFDTPANARRFISMVRPSMAIFIKYEFWGNYLSQLRQAGIPAYLVSAIFRPGQIFFRRWGGAMRRVLRCFSHIYLQDSRSASLLESIGIDNTTVAGDTRFDRVTDVMKTGIRIPGFPGFGTGHTLTFIAGSSWPADEEIYIPWLRNNPGIAFVIAPHEFDGERLASIRAHFGHGETMLLSEWMDAAAKGAAVTQVRGIIVDSFGKLSTLYRFADMAYIGGGFGAGIHNINEAAVYGIPVIFGPNHSKFKEATDIIAAGGGFAIDSPGTFMKVADTLLDTPRRTAAGNAAGSYIRRSTGASDTIAADLFK